MVRVPFDVEMAKKITNGEVEGKIVTRSGKNVRIVCFDRKSELNRFPILALIENGIGETSYISNSKGYTNFDGKETPSDLFIEIPEYMTFKDGDIIYARTDKFYYIFIYMGNGKDKTYYCAALDEEDTLWIGNNRITCDCDISELRFATKEEQQKLIDALKASKQPKAKECLEMLGIEVNPKCEFRPKDWVLCYSDGWNLCQFSHTKFRDIDNKLMYVTVGGIAYDQCIPYNEQTAHLLGTTYNWEE